MNIETLRKRSGFSQRGLAETLGIHQTAISQWEKGRASPTASKVSRLCEVLNCSPDELFSTQVSKQGEVQNHDTASSNK